MFRNSLTDDILANISGIKKASAPKVTEADVDAQVERMRIRGYEPSEQSRAAVRAYLECYGLFLMGNVGTGKTFFFKKVNPTPITIFSLQDHALDSAEEIKASVLGVQDREVVFDDIGTEPTLNRYGTRFEILPWIVEQRLELRCRTHFTTNIQGAQLRERYGDRTLDRIKSLCKAFPFTGESQRTCVQRYIPPPTYDWTLCRERCANFNGGRCACGVTVPPDCCEWPEPPEECRHFKKLGE